MEKEEGPVGHVGDGAEGEDEGAVGVGAAVLPPAEGGGEELPLGAVGLGDDGGEAAVGEERVGRAANTDGIVVAGLVGERPPLGGLVDGVRLQDEAALRAHRVPRRVVERHLRVLLAVRAERVTHLAPAAAAAAAASLLPSPPRPRRGEMGEEEEEEEEEKEGRGMREVEVGDFMLGWVCPFFFSGSVRVGSVASRQGEGGAVRLGGVVRGAYRGWSFQLRFGWLKKRAGRLSLSRLASLS